MLVADRQQILSFALFSVFDVFVYTWMFYFGVTKQEQYIYKIKKLLAHMLNEPINSIRKGILYI